jgi:hypothetical protein
MQKVPQHESYQRPKEKKKRKEKEKEEDNTYLMHNNRGLGTDQHAGQCSGAFLGNAIPTQPQITQRLISPQGLRHITIYKQTKKAEII